MLVKLISVSKTGTGAHFYYNGLTLLPAWINNYIHCEVWSDIIFSFLNFNGATVEV